MKIYDNLDLLGNALKGIATPVNPTDAANKAYADAKAIPAGGTTGQALTKKTNTDYDTQWSAVSSGGGPALGLIARLSVGTSGGTGSWTIASFTGLNLTQGRNYRIQVGFYVQLNVIPTSSLLSVQIATADGSFTCWQQTVTSAQGTANIPGLVNFLYSPTSSSTGASITITMSATSSGTFIGNQNGSPAWIEDIGGSTPTSGVLGYIGSAMVTTNYGPIALSGTPSVDPLSLTVPLIAGARYRLTLSVAYAKATTDVTAVQIDIHDGGAIVAYSYKSFSSASEEGMTVLVGLYTAAASGNKTFSVRYSAGTTSAGFWTAKGSVTMPRQLSIERIAV